jgi:hypothetical protein
VKTSDPSRAAPPIFGGWNGAALLAAVAVQAAVFYTQIAMNIAPYYPDFSDQTGYLFRAYTIATTIQTQGVWPVLKQALQPDSPNGAIFPFLGGFLVALTGMPRAGALTVHLLGFLLLQFVVFWFVRQRTGRNSDAWIAISLILMLHAPFYWAGGIFDYRIDFLALCQFGIWTTLALHSGLFRSTRWSVVTGLAAAWMCSTRYIAFAYFAPAMGTVFIVSLIVWMRTSQPERREVARLRVKNILLSGGIAAAVAVPFIWMNRINLYRYYFVGLFVSEEKEFRAKQAGLSTTFDHLSYYPNRLLEHLGAPWRYAAVALVVWGFIAVVMRRHQPIKDIASRLCTILPEFAFLTLVISFPFLILNSSIHKSPIVIGILCVPFTLFAVLIITSLRDAASPPVDGADRAQESPTWARSRFEFVSNRALPIGLAALALAVFCVDAGRQKIGLSQNDKARINTMYDSIIGYIHDNALERSMVSIDRTVDFSPNHIQLALRNYEQFGRLLPLRGGFGSGSSSMFATPRAEALKAFESSDIITLTDKRIGRDVPFPMNRAIQAYWDEVSDWAKTNLIQIHSTDVNGVPYAVYARPSIKLLGASGGWVTSGGLILEVDSRALVRWPYISVEGAISYEWLGGEPSVRAIRGNDEKSALPVTFQRVNPNRYRIVVDARAAASETGGRVRAKVTFDKFFVAKQLGLNNDERELVLRDPDKRGLAASP